MFVIKYVNLEGIMKRFKRLGAFIIIALLVSSVTGYRICGAKEYRNTVDQSQLTQSQKLEDFEYMYNILKDNYPYFEVNKRMNGVDWLANKDKYVKMIKDTDNDRQFKSVLGDIMLDFNNGHCDVLNYDSYLYYKKLYGNKYADISGAWIEQLNNDKAVKRYMPQDIQTDENAENKVITDIDNIKIKILIKNKAAYMGINSLYSFCIQSDMKAIKLFLESIKGYKCLIIDIRGNGGGDSSYWQNNIVPMLINKPLDYTEYCAYRGGKFTEQFIKSRTGFGYDKLLHISKIYDEGLSNLPPELKDSFKYYVKSISHIEPVNSIGFQGKIFLLVDHSVFSSAEKLADFAKCTGFATIIGERTGGDGIGDDPAFCTLPNSGFIIRFTKEMGLSSDGRCNFECKTDPDIKVPAGINKDMNNDKAIQAALKLIN